MRSRSCSDSDRNLASCNFLDGFMQSDDECCNSCEEVREAYSKKGWALGNVDLIDQVSVLNRIGHCISRLHF